MRQPHGSLAWKTNCTPGYMEKKTEVVVVTGASAGVGRATAQEFAKHGAVVALVARGEAGLAGAKREVEALGGKARIVLADIGDPDQVEAAAEDIEGNLGPIDIWVNNAMVSVFSPASEMEYEEIRRITDVTYLGTVYGTLAALRRMRHRNRGAIVQVGSALAYRSIPLQSAYCGAKHAIRGFTNSVRAELLHDGINVNLTMVHLPALNTPQFEWVKSRLPSRPQPVPPIYQPEVAARAIFWAAHHKRRELIVGAPTIMAILGERLFPRLLDRFLARHGYSAQQTDEPANANRLHNLWRPLLCDFGVHGRFGDRSKATSFHCWVATHRPLTYGSVGGVLALACVASRMKLKRHNSAANHVSAPILRSPKSV